MASTKSDLNLYGSDDAEVSYKIRKIWFPVAIVVGIILLVICIVLAILYSQAVNKSEDSPRIEPPTKYEICDEASCFSLGLELVKKMNRDADPCQDFFAYACEGWQERNPLKNNVSDSRRTITSVTNKNSEIIKTALEQAHLNYSQNAAIMKTLQVYNSCLNTTAIDSYGLQPLKDLIKEYGGWSVSSNYDPSVTLETRIGRYARELNVKTLINVETTIDPYDSNKTLLQVTVGPPWSLAELKNFDYSSSESQSKQMQILLAYQKYMKAVGRMFGTNSTDEKMMAIFTLEFGLLLQIPGESLKRVNELHELIRKNADKDLRMTLSSFCNQSGFPLPFIQAILKTIFGRDFTGEEKLIAGPMEGFKVLYKIYQSNQALLADYFMWRAVNQYLDALGSNYTSAKEELLRSLPGSPPEPRWKQCISHMLEPFDMTLGLLYVDARFSDDTKQKIEEMIENIRSSFIEKLDDRTWMDSQTREKAKQKALAIIADIGYPLFIKNPRKLEAHYASLNVTDNLFENFKALQHFARMINVDFYWKPVNKSTWVYGSPATYNGFFFPSFNRIVFLAGILQPPMYNPGFPRYINYGGIGTVIGHEITHGFDGTGRLYDKNGNLRNWWSDSADSSFKEKAKCFEKQYNNYKVFDKYVNGSFTLNENIADNGGIKIAYDAYQKWTKENGPEKHLPGLHLNPDQLFFVGFAQAWCSIFSKGAAYSQLQNDNHALDKYRVIGSLSNFKKFSEVFKCSTNSRMNPSDKCAIW